MPNGSENSRAKPRICAVLPVGNPAGETLALLPEKSGDIETFERAQPALNAMGQRRFDIMITTLELGPGDMDAITLIRKARHTSASRKIDMPILILAGALESETLLNAFYAGATDHLVSPVTIKDLDATIERLLSQRSNTRLDIPAEPQRRICLVDGDRVSAARMQKSLLSNNFSIEHYPSVETAFAALQKKPFDLLITAQHIGHSANAGTTLITELRRRADLPAHNIPTLVLTDDHQEATVTRVFEAGADDYLAGHPNEAEFISRVRNLSRRSHANAPKPAHPVQVAAATADTVIGKPRLSVVQDLTPEEAATSAPEVDVVYPSAPAVSPAEVFADMVVRFRWLAVLLCLLLIGGLGLGLKNLGFSSDPRVFFGPDNPQLQAFEALEATYTKNSGAMILIAPADGDVFSRQTLTAVEELTDAAWQTPYSSRVDSLSNFQHSYAQDDDLIVNNLYEEAAELSDQQIAEIRGTALGESLLVNRLISPGGHVTGVNINVLLPRQSENESVEVATFVRQMVRTFEQRYPDLLFHITGSVMLDTAFAEATAEEITTRMPIMYGVILVAIGLLLRSITGTLATLIVIGASTAAAMGMAGWSGILITTPSAGAPIIIMTLAVADSVHILASLFQFMREGMHKRDAIIESLRVNAQPVVITSVTTAIGFLSMNASDSPPFHDLGNIVAAGVIAAMLFSLVLLPALLAILPLRAPKRRHPDDIHMLDRLAGFVVRHRNPLMWSMVVVVLGLSASITLIELNDNVVEYFDERYEFRRSADYAQENLRGIHGIEYSIRAAELGSIHNPEYLNKLDQLTEWLRRQPGVAHVDTVSDIFKRLNKNMHGDDEFYYRLPDDNELASQYLLLYELSLPRGLDLTTQVNLDKSASRLSVALENLSTREILELEKNTQQWMDESLLPGMNAVGTGGSIMFANIARRNIESMLGGTIIALLLISGLLVIALRNVKLGLVSLVPNLVPAAMAFGLWGLFRGEVGLAVSVVSAMSLGIVVDDTVHFLSKYQRARREKGFDGTEAVRYSIRNVGAALIFTTIILCAGFLVLATSGFSVNADMGLLTAITIALALATDLLLLPPLLMKLDGKPNKQTAT